MQAQAKVILRVCRHAITVNRQLSVTPIAYKTATATDPVQQLFVDKVRLYAQKSKTAGGKLVDASPAAEAKYKAEIERVEKTFGAISGEDFTKFPTFNFQDTELEPLSVDVEISADAAEADEAAEEYDYPTWLGEVKL